MTTLNNYARPEWAAPRKETWYEHLLPQRATDAINQSPLVGALSKYLNSPTPDLTLPSQRDSQVPMPRAPSWFDDKPIAAEAVDRAGFLANFLAPGVKLPPQAPKPQGIRAYHGSPHDFDKFDISKIGTGEGAQAYGRGLYFAEAEAVAMQYRDNLAPKPSVNFKDPISIASEALRFYGDPKKAAASFRDDLAANPSHPMADLYRGAAEALERGKVNPRQSSGRIYEVKINADPETFLDWDKPIAQQSEAVRRAMPSASPEMTGELAYRRMAERQRTGQKTGDPLNDVLFDIPITDHKAASQSLREAGIPGIRYKDAGSRGTDAGTSNYVVFDDKLIEILRKYGLLPPVAAGAASLAQPQEPPL